MKVHVAATLLTIASLHRAAAADVRLAIHINNADDFCMILPSWRSTIGASEDGGKGAKAFCKYPEAGQGHLPSNADGWRNGPHFFKHDAYVQITGCIRPEAFHTLLSSDDGGQYDAKGGDGGRGNPPNSYCKGYSSYVELVGPSSGEVCVRCCHDDEFCPLQFDTEGCRKVVPNGDYSC